MSQVPATTGGKSVAKAGGSKALQAFLSKAGTAVATSAPISPAPRTPRVVFALDATASRGPTWQKAQKVQSEMFRAMSGRGQVQLASFGGQGFRASWWAQDSMELAEEMAAIRCVPGTTQIEDVLRHISAENKKQRISAVVYVGDTMEENEEALVERATRLGALGIPVFIFHEIGTASAEPALRRIAEASGGAYARFPEGDPAGDLQPLLGAVAAYAEGGKKALLRYGEQTGNAAVKAIGHQLKIEGPKS